MRYNSESLFSQKSFYIQYPKISQDNYSPQNMIIKSLNRFIEYENILCWP